VLGFLDAGGSRKESKVLKEIDLLTEELLPLEYEYYLTRPRHPHPKLISLLGERGLLDLANWKKPTSVENKGFLARLAAKLARISLSPVLLVLTHTLQASHLLVYYAKDKSTLNKMGISNLNLEGNLLAYIGPPFSFAKYSHDGNFILLDVPPQAIPNGALADRIAILAQDDSGSRASVLVIGKHEVEVLEEAPARVGLLTTDIAILALKLKKVPIERALAIDVPLQPISAKQTHTALVWLVGALAGIAKEVLLSVIERSRQRIQWGKPIYQHELVRKHIAGIFRDLQVLDALALYLCSSNDRPRAAVGRLNSGSNVKEGTPLLNVALELATDVVDRAVQVFGGFGYSLLSPVARYYLDVQALSTLLRNSIDFDEVSAKAALMLT